MGRRPKDIVKDLLGIQYDPLVATFTSGKIRYFREEVRVISKPSPAILVWSSLSAGALKLGGQPTSVSTAFVAPDIAYPEVSRPGNGV
jgi:hypothetical protein